MNTQLKKGDKCQSLWGECIVTNTYSEKGLVDIRTPTEAMRYISTHRLTRIPSFSEEMQAVLDIAWDVENRLEDSETVQLRVGQFVKFVRHYCAIKDAMEMAEIDRMETARQNTIKAKEIEKLLKGETTI